MIPLKQKTSESQYKKYLIRYRVEYCERYGIKRDQFEQEKRRVKYTNKGYDRDTENNA